MKKSIMALEGIEEEVIEETTPVIEINSSEIDNEVESIASQFDQVSEADGISNTVDGIVDSMEKTIETGEGVSEENADLTNIVMEHFYNRLGYAPKIGKQTISVEDFKDKTSNLKNTKLAIEQLNKFNEKLRKNISIAQEGLIENINQRISSSANQLDAINASLDKVSKDFDTKGPTTENIPTGRWANSLGIDSSSDSTGEAKEVLTVVTKIEASLKRADLPGIISDMCNVADEIALELTKDKNQVSNHNALNDKLVHLSKIANEVKGIVSSNKDLSFSNVKALNAQEKNELVKALKSICKELKNFSDNWSNFISKIENIKKIAEKIKKSGTKTVVTGDKRLLGFIIGFLIPLPFTAWIGLFIGSTIKTTTVVEDNTGHYKNQADQASSQAENSMNAIIVIDAELVKVCAAAVTYIEKSTAK